MVRKTIMAAGTNLKKVFKRFVREGCTYRAASLAYATLLSLIPIMIISINIISFLPIGNHLGDQIRNLVFSNLIADSAHLVVQYLDKFMDNAKLLSKTNVVFLFTISVLMIYNMSAAINGIWNIKIKRNFFASLLLYFIMLVLTPIFIAVALWFGSYIMAIPIVYKTAGPVFLDKPLLFLLPYFFSFIVFSLVNWAFPVTKVPVWAAMAGGLLTTILFQSAKHLFSLYVLHVHTYHLLYGTMAIIPLFLIWLFVSWIIILFGCMVTHLVATKLGWQSDAEEDS